MDITVTSIKSPSSPISFYLITTNLKKIGKSNFECYKCFCCPLKCPPGVRPWGAWRVTVQIHVKKMFNITITIHNEQIWKIYIMKLIPYERLKLTSFKLLYFLVGRIKNIVGFIVHVYGFSCTVRHRVYCHSFVLKVVEDNTERSRQPVTQLCIIMLGPVIGLSIAVYNFLSCRLQSLIFFVELINAHSVICLMLHIYINNFLIEPNCRIFHSTLNRHEVYRFKLLIYINNFLIEQNCRIFHSSLNRHEVYGECYFFLVTKLPERDEKSRNSLSNIKKVNHCLICNFRHSNPNLISSYFVLLPPLSKGGHGEVFADNKMVSWSFSIIKWRLSVL